jgi:hypothetical protein
MSQNARLTSYLQRNSVTQLEAFSALGICRLSERIRELERLGWVIRHDRVQVPTRDKPAYVTRYTLVAEPQRSGEHSLSISLPDTQSPPALALHLSK